MARFHFLCVAFLAVAATSANAAQIPVYSAGAFAADSDQAAEPVAKVAQEAEQSEDYGDYYNEGRSLSQVSANDLEEEDELAFHRLVDKLLWTHNTGEVEVDARGFEYQPQRRGLFRIAKPAMLEDEGMIGEVYDGFVGRCYRGACKLGLGGLFASFEQMLEGLL